MQIRILEPADFPRALGEIPKPPEQLWLRGSLPPAGTKHLAVVGSRALTRYGREACEYLIEGLAGYPISIISGLALGADACAHRAALAARLHTIAIPGSGLEDFVIAPRTNYSLAHDILKVGGALLSEQEPHHEARPEDFPSRNRLMVGLADAVLVIEAGEQSGTLITCRLAADYNRDLLCIPHRIGDPHAVASHTFLRIGATLVSEPAHILLALGIEPRVSESALPLDLSEVEQKLYDALTEPRERDELIRHVELPAHEVLGVLGILELRGVVKEEFGLWRRAS
jgi:DNA processing protein